MAIKYKEIADRLEKEIQRGKFDQTKKLPTEEEMIKEFEVSRNTIRKAVTQLVIAAIFIKSKEVACFCARNQSQTILT